jgi:hypothetical protein
VPSAGRPVNAADWVLLIHLVRRGIFGVKVMTDVMLSDVERAEFWATLKKLCDELAILRMYVGANVPTPPARPATEAAKKLVDELTPDEDEN